MILSREQVLQSSDVIERIVDVPEWGGEVKIKTLTKGRQLAMRKAAMVDGKADEDRLEVLIFMACVVEPQFTESDFEALKDKSASAMDRVLKEIYAGSGMTKEDAKAIDKSFPSGS